MSIYTEVHSVHALDILQGNFVIKRLGLRSSTIVTDQVMLFVKLAFEM